MTDIALPDPISYAAVMAGFAKAKPQAPAMTFENETLSWIALHKITNRVAHAMEKRGVKQGDYVTVALPNGMGFILACWGAWKLGAVPQPVSARLPRAELDAIVALANPSLLVARAGTESDRAHVDVDVLLSESSEESDLPDRTAPSWKAMTSGGSTGRPKLIVTGDPGVKIPGTPGIFSTEERDTLVMPGPMYHNGPFISVFGGHMVGAHAVLMPRFDPEETLKTIERHKATWIYLVPTMMGRIWRLPDEVKKKYDLSSLRMVWHLAAPCPAWLKEAWIDWLGADVIWELYGGTEGQAATVITGQEWLTHRGSVGRPIMGEIRAFDEKGEMLPAGEIGEIFMRRAPNDTGGYRYVGATARSLRDGWESLGDIGYLDEEGYLYLADRRTDMILVGGANVYPAEIESALDEHPLVQSSCVIGLPDDDMGNRVHAIVQPRAGLTEADLRAHVAAKLVTYKQPRSYEFVDEPLRDDAGKVRRTALRDERIKKA